MIYLKEYRQEKKEVGTILHDDNTKAEQLKEITT